MLNKLQKKYIKLAVFAFHETQIGGRSVFLFFTKELVFIIITFFIYSHHHLHRHRRRRQPKAVKQFWIMTYVGFSQQTQTPGDSSSRIDFFHIISAGRKGFKKRNSPKYIFGHFLPQQKLRAPSLLMFSKRIPCFVKWLIWFHQMPGCMLNENYDIFAFTRPN